MPFLSVEQAALSHVVGDVRRTAVLAWYNIVGSCSTALGALAGGLIAEAPPHFGLTGTAAFRPVLLAYAGIGVALSGGIAILSSAVEATRDESRPPPRALLGLHESRRVVFKLSLLFARNAFGGGFVIQSLIAYTLAAVRPDERSAPAGVTGVARSVGASISPLLATLLVGNAGLMSIPFFLAGDSDRLRRVALPGVFGRQAGS